MKNRPFIRIPKTIIANSNSSGLYTFPYIFLAYSAGYSQQVTFTVEQFRQTIRRSCKDNLKEQIITALCELESDNRIKFKNDGQVFYCTLLEDFYAGTFGLLYIDEIKKLLNYPNPMPLIKVIHMLAFLRANMTDKGLYYKTFKRISKMITFNPTSVRDYCRKLKELDIIEFKQIDLGRKPDGSYTSKAKLQLFADKTKIDWNDNLIRLEKELKGKVASEDDLDLW